MLASGFAVVDVETTGLDPERNRVLEVAVIRLTPEGEPIGEYATLVRPDGPPPAGDDGGVAAEIHGITEAELGAAPTFRQVATAVATNLTGAVVAGHNVAFDLRFLGAEFRRAGVGVPVFPSLCTQAMAGRLHPELERRRLTDCCEAAGVPLDGAHTALGDARATAWLLAAYLATARVRGATTFAELGCFPLVPAPRAWPTGLPYWSGTHRRDGRALPDREPVPSA